MWLRFFWLCATSVCLIFPIALEANGYRLGVGDRVRLRVYPDDTFDVELRVRSDGSLQVPLLGGVDVAGKTVAEVGELLQKQLTGEYYRDPTVILEILEYIANRAHILGAVKNPGPYPISSGDRILDLIQKAGGLSSRTIGFAYIFERVSDSGKANVQRVSLQRILQNSDFSENVLVPDDATIYLVEDERVFVMGGVVNPGAYEASVGSSLIRAVTLAGGFTPRANDKKVWIYRGIPLVGTEFDMQKLIDKNMTDPVLQPGDLVFVPERFF